MKGSEGISSQTLPALNGSDNHEGDCDHIQKKRHLSEAPLQTTSIPMTPTVESGVHQFAARKETIDNQVTCLIA